jgi:hypothetical protein
MVTKTADILHSIELQVYFSSSHQYVINSASPSLLMRAQEGERMGKK